MSFVVSMLAGSMALAADRQTLVWDLSINGQQVGRRSLVIKHVPTDEGVRRILELWTEVDGQVGASRVNYRQRLTAHAVGRSRAAFQSVVEENGSAREIQGRETPTGWMVTLIQDGRERTQMVPLERIQLSTVDLLDPSTTWTLARFDALRMLSAETGDVAGGEVSSQGMGSHPVGGASIPVTTYHWEGPQGRSVFSFSTDGYLVHSETPMLGLTVSATLSQPPPGGPDDFPVALWPAAVEVLPL